MKDLELDTIYWHFAKTVPMYHGSIYEITETKLHGWRLWDTKTDSQIDVCNTLDEAKQKAELHKQQLAILS